MKIELHCHTKYGSGCGLADFETIVSRYVDADYNGVVITNHYYKSAFESYKGDSKKEKLDFYFSLYEKVKEEGERRGLKVFLGSEIAVQNQNDYLFFGFDRKLFYDNKPLYEFTQKELFDLSEKNHCFFAQAHPFRKGVKAVGDPKYMHGVELFNGHYHHYNNNDLAREFCDKNNLIGLSGTDFHTPTQPITSGIILPQDIENETELVKHLFNKDFKIYCDEERYLSARDEYYKGERI